MNFTTCIALGLLMTGCAHTDFFRDGKRVAHFEGDMTAMRLAIGADGSLTWSGDISHSAATRAVGSSVARSLQSAGTMAGGIGAAIATSGLKP